MIMYITINVLSILGENNQNQEWISRKKIKKYNYPIKMTFLLHADKKNKEKYSQIKLMMVPKFSLIKKCLIFGRKVKFTNWNKNMKLLIWSRQHRNFCNLCIHCQILWVCFLFKKLKYKLRKFLNKKFTHKIENMKTKIHLKFSKKWMKT